MIHNTGRNAQAFCPAQDDWDKHLDAAEFAINNAWQESVQNTPFMLNKGQHPLTPASADIDHKVPQNKKNAKIFSEDLHEAVRMAKQAWTSAQQRQAQCANQKRRDVTYKIGDSLLLSTKNIRLKTPGAKKLLPKWIGPYKVLSKVGRVAYQRHSKSMMSFMCLCRVLTLQMEQYSHLHPFSLRMRNSLRLTESLITGIASCAEKATNVSSLFVGLAMALSTTHGNQKRTYRAVKKPLGITGNLLNSNSLPMREYHVATVSSAKTSLARHRIQRVLVTVTVSSVAYYSCFQ